MNFQIFRAAFLQWQCQIFQIFDLLVPGWWHSLLIVFISKVQYFLALRYHLLCGIFTTLFRVTFILSHLSFGGFCFLTIYIWVIHLCLGEVFLQLLRGVQPGHYTWEDNDCLLKWHVLLVLIAWLFQKLQHILDLFILTATVIIHQIQYKQVTWGHLLSEGAWLTFTIKDADGLRGHWHCVLIFLGDCSEEFMWRFACMYSDVIVS